MAFHIHDLHDAYFGENARFETGRALASGGCTKALLLYDHSLVTNGFVDELIDIIQRAWIEVAIYEIPDGEPRSSQVDAIAAFFRANGCDGIAALGGGTTIDYAKMVGKVLANGGKAADHLKGYTTAYTTGLKRFSPIVGIPTTGGTGSESCWGLMCLNEETGKKTFAVHPCSAAVCDPVYSVTMPSYVTAFSGIDALAQCAESLCNTYAIKNSFADCLCREGTAMAYKYLPIAVKEPRNLLAREKMLEAAFYSGYVLSMRKTSIGHALANQISDAFHLPHGVGVGCGLAVQARYNVKGAPEITKVWAPLFGVDCPDGADLEAVGLEIVRRIDALEHEIGLKSMKQLGIPKDFCSIAADRISQDTKWKIVPNPPDFELMRECIFDAWDNYTEVKLG